MKAIILAAGYAVRMYPMTKKIAKPLINIADKPIIEYIIEKIRPITTKIYVVTNNKFFPQFEKWLKYYPDNENIEILNDGTMSEDVRLGALGDIQFVIDKKKLDEDLMIIAGDNLFQFGLEEMKKFFKEKNAPVIALYDVKNYEYAKKFGIAEINKKGRIVSFEEKPHNPKSTLSATLIYMFTKNTIKQLNEYMEKHKSRDQAGHFIQYLYKKSEVYGFVYGTKPNEKWFDIGSFEGLEAADKEYRSKKKV
ncbi:nucleotidyltransferase family protein [Candidatus Woesearchaeota archaeon]|nr:MAG: nucleotidyltransferase family protein [Candidatus Woesearchaeota archaeon]